MADVTVIDHPLIQHKLSIMRKNDTSANKFRSLMREISLLLAYEVTRDLPLRFEDIETPLAKMRAPFLDGRDVCLMSILRAGSGLLDGMLQLIPTAKIGHIGLYRDPKTLVAVEYYFKVPSDLSSRDVIVVDPMLATGHSAVAAVNRLMSLKPKSVKFVCLLAAPEGIKEFQTEHPGVPIYTACIDERLNEKGYILPGMGDAGDRLFGT